MKYFIKYLLFASITLTFMLYALVASAQNIIPAPPQLKAQSYILLDANTGKILVEHNADEQLPPASLTKMMTAYIAEREITNGNIHLKDLVQISRRAWEMKGSLMFLEVGEKVSVAQLLKGIIIVSGNDASVAMAEHIAGSEDAFVGMMNATAKEIGMTHTNFENASGYPDKNHFSTAHDLALLARRIVEDYPERYAIYKQKYFQFGVDKTTGKPLNRQPNRNRLLWSDPSVDGLKTGHTEAAGYCLAVSAKRDNRRLVAVVMKTPSEYARSAEAKKLLTYGFRFYDNVTLATAKAPIKKVRVWKGNQEDLDVGIMQNLQVTVPNGSKKDLKTVLQIDQQLVAPIKRGQQVGTINVMLDKKTIKEVPIVALKAIDKGSFLSRVIDTIVIFFKGVAH